MKTIIGYSLIFVLSLIAGLVYAGDFQEGVDDSMGKHFKVAFENLKSLAEEGDKESQYNLGLMNELGDGVPRPLQPKIKR